MLGSHIVRAGWILKEGDFLRGSAGGQRPLCRILLVLFLPEQEKNSRVVEAKIFPQPLLIVDEFSVENFRQNFSSHLPVETCAKRNIRVWIKKR